MTIAIDVSPLTSGHKVRGSGFYLQYLKDALETYFPSEKYVFLHGTIDSPSTYDVVHIPYFEPFFGTLSGAVLGNTIVTIHDLIPLVFPTHFPAGIRGKLMWYRQKGKLKKVGGIITDSVASKQDIVRLTGVSVAKVHVIPLAAAEGFGKKVVPESAKKALKEKYSLPDTFALYVGDATWNKNLPRLVQAVKQRALPLVMVGKALTQTVDENNVWNKDLVTIQSEVRGARHIQRLGFVSTEELVVLYSVASVLVMPSLYEGFGLPILEAMVSGCPVITTKRGSLAEVAGDAAYFVDAESEESIGEGIETVLKDPKLRKKLKAAGIEQAKKFSWEKTATETMALYRSLMHL